MNRSLFVTGRGLYAITPSAVAGKKLLAVVEAALAGGARVVQYRAKPVADPETARRLGTLCQQAGAIFIVNDEPDLALEVGADGVHLGRDDASPAAAREILGPDRIVGVSCYNDLRRAQRAAAEGADYLAFGSVFGSTTKPGAAHCPLKRLAAARVLGLPIVAIGGITLDNAAAVIAAGADYLAVISNLFEAPDIGAHAAAYGKLFNPAG
ncbi:MAG: thiamine phosphate synthase [Wenzhouxiangellaceae bacterium]